jgi:hypothetical protein
VSAESMENQRVGFGAIALAVAFLVSGCSNGGPADGGDGGWNDSGPDCIPDAGYCNVCHFMTACGEYPSGPYGMVGPTTGPDGGDVPGMILPPCFTGSGFWNPTGVLIIDGGNPKFASNATLFQDLYCAGQQQSHPSTFALIQFVVTDEPFGRMQAPEFTQCLFGPEEQWLASGGQVIQIIEATDNGLAPSQSDLIAWVSNYGTNYSIGSDDNQDLYGLVDATHGWPVTMYVNLQNMQILYSASYGGDFGGIQNAFTNILDAGHL